MPVRPLLALLALVLMTVSGAESQTPVPLTGVKRVLFLGNSITYAGDYLVEVELALLARGVEVEVLNLGLPSETATTLTAAENAEHERRHGFGRPFLEERLARVLAETRPELLFASYGINDGSSLAPGEESVRRFGEAMERLRSIAAGYGVREVVHLTPPVYDARANPEVPDYDPTLARFSEWLLDRRRDGWLVVDVHGAMRRALDEGRARDPAFALARDGVHPGPEGHALMARQLLALLGIAPATDAPEELRALVRERMALLRDAWLARTRHTRPGLRPGLPLEEAVESAARITTRIHSLRTGITP